MTHPAPAVALQIREALSDVLGLPPEEVPETDDLISQGLDSIRIMALVGRWRSVGIEVDYSELAKEPTVEAWTHLLAQRLPLAPVGETGRCTGGTPTPAGDAPDGSAPFPLTPVQQAYWIGRADGQALGGNGCHAYIEFDGQEVHPERLEAAVHALVARHGMLRARFLEDGTQQVAASSPWPGLTVHDLRELSPQVADDALDRVRQQLSHRRFDVAAGHVFDVQLSLRPGGSTRIHFGIDLLVADVLSIQHLLAEMAAHYAGEPGPPPAASSYTFAHYLADLAAQRGSFREKARAYWQERLPELPGGPALPLAVNPDQVERPRFVRRTTRLAPEAWRRFTERARAHRVTPAMALAAAYAEVLGAWSSQQRFVLNLPLFDRQPLHPEVSGLVADFTNLVLVTADTSDAAPFAEHARRLQAQFQSDAAHAEYSAVDVLRDLARARPGERVTAPVVFASNIGSEFVDERFRGTLGRFGWMISQTPQVWLDHQVYEESEGLLLAWDAAEELFHADVLDDMFDAYGQLVRDLAESDGAWTSPVPALLPERQRALRARINDTAVPEPGRLLHDAVVDAARNDGEQIALRWGTTGRMSYDELLHRALAVAGELRARDLGTGEPVAVILDKGWEQIVAVLGILLAGGAYLPVDTNQPPARRDVMLADAGVRELLTHSRTAAFEEFPASLHTTEIDTLSPASPGTAVPEVRATGDDLAYVIYTSGSTGRPKGVMISHRSAVNTVADISGRFRVTAEDRGLALAALGFDLSVYDIFGLLGAGGCLVLTDPDRRGDPSHWAELIARHRVTVWNSVPAQLQMLQQYAEGEPDLDLTSLRLAMLSGDWIPVNLPDAVRRRCPGLELISLGGATEAAIWSIFHPIGEVPADWHSIPYGKPLANQSFQVLDAALRPRPELVPGELWIGGLGVAMGYLGDAERTAERFVTHPLTGERLYRTGDLGRYLPNGSIEFLGREDSQVKVRGHRIELAEVEAALLSHPDIEATAVVVDGTTSTNRRIAAVVTGGRRAEAVVTAEAVKGPAQAAHSVASRAAGHIEPARVTQEQRRLNRVAFTAIAAALRATGAFSPDAAAPTTDQVLRRAGVPARFHRVVRRWLKALEGEGLVHRDPDTGRYRNLMPADTELLEQELRRLETEGCEPVWTAPVLPLLTTSMRRLPELLRGELDQVRLLFPDGGTDTARALYSDNAIMRYLNRATAALASGLAAGAAPGRPFRVLEVGAGIGATTDQIVPALAAAARASGVEPDYLFTDVSHFFLNEVRGRFAAHPWLRYGLFDFNGGYRAQGFRPQSFDMIVIANALHNARDIDTALGGLRELLAPGGWLVITELTVDRPDLMTWMEFLIQLDGEPDGEGDFEDRRRGRDQTFFGVEEWRLLLTEAGAQAVVVLPEEGGDLDVFGQHLIAASFKRDRVDVDLEDLRDHLAEQLPEYMIPAHIETVEALPLSANGKVDRTTVLSWVADGRGDDVVRSAPPPDELERRLAGLWEELLGVSRVARDDDFYELGGDSLLVTQFIGRLRRELPQAGALAFDELLRTMVRRPTLAAVADRLRQVDAEEVADR
ncbi:non-ribosomal peptide synthetase [Streptomyces sp. YU58]|uniref:non-ribosomal peptide synthetase n=1 Tax=Streptomyces sp. SX92 TaxID=3158972 RepID=UPI0027BA21C3|nr:non-ribosomal peptide synthetase [Streptomyces coralus]WLW50146.1 amino acid adenylation domain-containing protein [Streptomyces coralus]